MRRVRSMSSAPASPCRFPRLARAVAPPVGRTYATPCSVTPEQARHLVDDAVFRRWLRPSDAREATRFEPLERLWIPYWRVESRLDGEYAYVYGQRFGRDRHSVVEKRVDGRTVGGIGYVSFAGDKAFTLVCARREAPFSSPSVTESEVLGEGVPTWHLEPSDLWPIDRASELFEEHAVLVDADLDEDRACLEARRSILARTGPDEPAVVLRKPTITLVGAAFVYLPCYYAPYRYAGEATPAGGSFLVVLSGRTGTVWRHDHPSSVRAMAARVRRLLSFDKRGLH